MVSASSIFINSTFECCLGVSVSLRWRRAVNLDRAWPCPGMSPGLGTGCCPPRGSRGRPIAHYLASGAPGRAAFMPSWHPACVIGIWWLLKWAEHATFAFCVGYKRGSVYVQCTCMYAHKARTESQWWPEQGGSHYKCQVESFLDNYRSITAMKDKRPRTCLLDRGAFSMLRAATPCVAHVHDLPLVTVSMGDERVQSKFNLCLIKVPSGEHDMSNHFWCYVPVDGTGNNLWDHWSGSIAVLTGSSAKLSLKLQNPTELCTCSCHF